MRVLCIHAHDVVDIVENTRLDLIQRVRQGYGAKVAQLQWITFLVKQQCVDLLLLVWGGTCHPHQDDRLVYGLLHRLRQIWQGCRCQSEMWLQIVGSWQI